MSGGREILDLLTFALADYRCPHCLHSLRFRLIKTKAIPHRPWKNGMIATHCEICPICNGEIKADWHPAIVDDWMWGKRLAPGILIWIAAIIMDFHPIIMMIGTATLLIGLASVLHYMISERWRRPYYVTLDTPTDLQV